MIQLGTQSIWELVKVLFLLGISDPDSCGSIDYARQKWMGLRRIKKKGNLSCAKLMEEI